MTALIFLEHLLEQSDPVNAALHKQVPLAWQAPWLEQVISASQKTMYRRKDDVKDWYP